MAGGRPTTMTVVFTDLVSSTAWRTSVGADVADARTAELERASRRIVEASGGTVVKSVGDGVMAAFVSATAAVEAASGLRELARRLPIGDGPDCLRVGVSSGDLLREGDDWLGTAAIEAARLCAEAAGGTILVADTTAGLIRGQTRARLQPIGRRLLRGFVTPIEVAELLDVELDGPRLPSALARAAETTLVGRAAELEHLLAELAAVGAGAARNLLLLGEPGIGKTRLAAALASAGARQGFEVLHGRCDEGLGAPYQPLVEAFEPWLAAHRGGARDALTERPALATLLTDLVQPALASPDGPASDPEVQRWQLFEDVAALVGDVAGERPVLLVVDDLQWAEPSARALLGHLARREVGGLFLVATVRPDPAAPDPTHLLGDLGTARSVHVVRLDGLADAEVAALVSAHASGDPPNELVRRLRDETDGNPFFLHALLDHLDEVAFVRERSGAWITPTELDAVGIPDGVRAVVHRRLAILDGPTRRVLEVAAVSGLAFAEQTITDVLEAEVDGTVSALDAAVAAGLVREEGPGRFAFVHALVQHTLTDGLSQTARARLHWRIAEALERSTRTHAIGTIATHYAAGRAIGSAETVLRTSEAAGEESMRRLAFDEAAGHFRIALAALDELPADPDVRYRLLTALGGAWNARATGDVGDEVWLEAAELARRAGDPVRLHAAILGYLYMIRVSPPEPLSRMIDALLDLVEPTDSALRATALGMRAMAWIGGDLSRSTTGDAQLADEAVAMARRVGDVSALALTLRARTNLMESSGTNAAAMLDSGRELVALRQAHGRIPNLDTGAEWRDVARALIRCGRAADADEYVRRARDDATATGERLMINAAVVIESALAAARGQFAESRRLATEAAQISGRAGRLDTLRFGAQIVAVMMEEGQLDDVIPLLRRVDSYDIVAPEWLAMLASALADAGQRAEAAAVLDGIDLEVVFNTPRFGKPVAVRYLAESCRLLDDRRLAEALLPLLEPWSGQILLVSPGSSIDGAADRSLAHVRAVLGRWGEADTYYAAAARLERTAGFPPHLARTEYWHARSLLERDAPGDRHRASALLDEVIEIGGRLGMRLLHQQAVALRASLST